MNHQPAKPDAYKRARHGWRLDNPPSGPSLAFALVMALVGLSIGFVIYQDYNSTLARERNSLQTHARVVDENLEQQLEGIAAALTNIRDDADDAIRAGQAQRIASRLKAMTDAMPGVRTMLALDSEGTVIAASRPELTGQSLAERAYFRRVRDRPDPATLYLSEPFKTTLDVFSVNLMKVWLRPDGRFGGVVTATLEPKHFEVLLRSVLYASGTRSALIHGDGQVFVRMPAGDISLGLNLANPQSFFLQHRASGQPEGFFVGRTFATGEERMVAFRNTQAPSLHLDAVLVTSISRPLDDVLDAWRRAAITHALLYAGIVATALVAFSVIQRKQRDFRLLGLAREQEARGLAQRLQLALAGGDLGLWEVDLVTGRRTVDARAQTMVGMAADAPAEDIAQWTERIHPDDKTGWIAARQSHVSGESDTLVRDFRARHRDGHWVWIHSRGKVALRDGQGRALRLAGTYLDITERKAAEARIARSEQLLARMSRVSRTGGWDHDLRTGRSTWSDEMFRIRELDPSVEPDRDLVMNAYLPESRAALLTAREAAIRCQMPWDMELQMVTATGHQIWVRSQGEAVVENGVTVALTGTLKNVTWRKQSQIDLQVANEKLERMAMSDGLTGIANRRLFDQMLQVEWQRGARAMTPLSLLMIDIDHFKHYNDHYGHTGGDDCLRQVAKALAACSRRAGDLVSRYGGEEFAILLPGADLSSAGQVAQACLHAIAAARLVHAASTVGPWVSVSIGLACVLPQADGSALSLVERADAALYQAKHHGRGRFATFRETGPGQAAGHEA